ncbi:MAG: hypothetical protein ACD_14C00064G0002 [uncultured bacterium]|nr:MAG: hypothetical protein ACD_14C00064G0002 [uncultured bacterium]
MTKEKITVYSFLLVSALSFFAFGLFHLGKFETTDEHLWKYGRIKQYWQAIEEKNWEKTYINDKPGVTVALVSGFGLLSYPDPEKMQLAAISENDPKGIFEKYDTTQIEKINIAFRLPILIFMTLCLFLFFALARKTFDSSWIALFSTMLVAFNPILLGMSQIINPDTFFWIFGGLSALAYLALINTKKKKFILICGALTGLALLSKYTAFMLFLFYALAAASKIIFQKPEVAQKTDWKYLWKNLRDIAAIFLISIFTFSVLLPAVFVKPEYLFKGISQFITTKNFILLSLIAIAFVLLAAYKRNLAGKFASILAAKKHIFIATICALFSFLIIISMINVWTGQKLARVDALRDAAYANEPKEFNFKPLIDKKNDNVIKKNAELFLMESYPFVFSLSPLLIFLIFFVSAKSFTKKISDENATILFPILSFSLLYFASTIFAGIVTNVRYSILLYPLFAILGAVTIAEIANNLSIPKKITFAISALIILIFGIISLWSLRPFYFSYSNSLLPKEFSIHDSWGHGSYEAAQYLNSLSDAENKIIWSNSDTVCRFFVGKCLRSRKINLDIATPDYFVISKRGELKLSNRFILVNNPNPEKDSDYYFEKLKDNHEWQLLIDNRPDNFIKIIKFEK